MDPDSSSLLLLLFLVITSGLFSGSETALFSLSRPKVEAMLSQGTSCAGAIKRLKSRPQKMLVVILLGNNVANVAATAVATVYFTNLFQSFGLGIVTGIMTLVILVFGEIFPKSIATKYPVHVAQLVVYPLMFIEMALYPLVWLFEKALMVVVGDRIHNVTEEEVVATVAMGAESGSLEDHEKELIENVLEFNDMNVEQVMTPRTEIKAVDISTTVQEGIEIVGESPFSRIPVYEGSIDNIKGFLTVKKLLHYYATGDKSAKLGDLDLYDFIDVPTTCKIYSLFLEFKKNNTHIALVYDEHGGVDGLVTMEDILEEIVGEIEDETDEREELIEHEGDSVVVDGDVPIEDIERALDIEIPIYDNKDDINWVILDFLKRFPKSGETLVIDHLKIVVEDIDGSNNKITKVRIVKL